MDPVISVLIRARNEERMIGRALKAVFEQDIDLPFEVILIDSGSTDGTVEIARGFDVRVYEIEPGSFTFGYALNYGKGLARGEYIINLSAHCIPVGPKWMDELVRPLVDDPAIAATYGHQQAIRGVNPFEEIDMRNSFTPDKNGDIYAEFSNSNCAVRKKVWDKFPFDEKASVAEDLIWAKTLPPEHRIKYVHGASVFHSHPLSLKYWRERFYGNGLFEPYLEKVYGLQQPLKASGLGARGFLPKVLTVPAAYAVETMQFVWFLVSRKYFLHALASPVFIIMRRYYYHKGLRDGRARSGGTESET